MKVIPRVLRTMIQSIMAYHKSMTIIRYMTHTRAFWTTLSVHLPKNHVLSPTAYFRTIKLPHDTCTSVAAFSQVCLMTLLPSGFTRSLW